MSSFDFSPTNCKKCGFLVWSGLSSTGISTKLDTEILTVIEEIRTLIQGGRTYQIHRTSVSFEATPRIGARMYAKDPKVLAMHTCKSEGFTFGQEVPDYFDTRKLSTVAISEGCPF